MKALRCVAGSLPPVNASREIPGGAERFCMEPLNIWRTCKREEGEEGGGVKGAGMGGGVRAINVAIWTEPPRGVEVWRGVWR